MTEPTPLSVGRPADPIPRPVPRLAPDAGQGLLVLPWRLLGVDQFGRRLTIRYAAGGGCVSPVGVQVIETQRIVMIGPRSRRTAPAGAACTAELLLGYGYLELAKPLGGRRLVHARVSPGWSNADP